MDGLRCRAIQFLRVGNLVEHFDLQARVYGMAGLINLRAGPRHSLSAPQSSSVRSLQASQLATRVANPLFPCTKLCKPRPLVAAALEVSKAPSSSGLANRQPSKG